MPENDRVDVIIVGGGYSGITAAWTLVEHGHSVIVLEARDRVGGRAWTEEFPGGFVDHGGQWIGPAQTQILRLAGLTGVETFPTYTEGNSLLLYKGERASFDAMVNDGLDLPVPRADLDDLTHGLSLIDELAREVPSEAPWTAARALEWDHQTLATWMDANLETEGAKFVVRIIVGGYFSVEPEDLSFLHFLFYISAAGGVEGLEESSLAWRFDGGAQKIPNILADRLGDRVHLEAPVRTIDQTGDGVEVESDVGGFSARRVVVALPPTMALRIAYRPALPPSRDQYTQRAPMGTTIKCHAVYPTSFWRAGGSNGQVVSEHDLNVTYDNSPPSGEPGILVGFLEGAPARRWADRPRHEIETMVISEFTDLFGTEARSPERFFLANWAGEEWSRGCYCGIPTPGTWTSYRNALREPVERLHWAGTETATEWTQYMEGAVRSGERVAAEVHAALNDAR